MYRHGDLYMYILFLQKGFLSSRREKKKKSFFLEVAKHDRNEI